MIIWFIIVVLARILTIQATRYNLGRHKIRTGYLKLVTRN